MSRALRTIENETKAVDRGGWRLMEQVMDKGGMDIEYV